MKNIHLIPTSCPFCGGKSIFTRGYEHTFIGGYNITIGLECEICPANMQTSYGNDGKIEITEESAYKYLTDCWNSKVTNESLDEAAQSYLHKVADGKRTTGYADEDFKNGAIWQAEQMYSEEELLKFGKSCFYKGFDKAENDDANCYTAFREEIGDLFQTINKTPQKPI